MKTKTFMLIMLVIAILTSCDKDDNNVKTNIDGNYIGTFERGENITNVEISFNNGIFNGQSDVEKFPALCNGSYSITENLITFENACPWTAEFDWTLILSGNWTYNIINNELILINDIGDKYTLTEQ
jgi:hypothetical protein